MGLKRNTEDQVVWHNQRDNKNWCGGKVGIEHNFYSVETADAYARKRTNMLDRAFLSGRAHLHDPKVDEWWFGRNWMIAVCEGCGKTQHTNTKEYESGRLNDRYKKYRR